MNFPIQIDSPEDKLAKTIAEDLVIDGIDSMLAFPLAVSLMSIIDSSHDDPNVGIELITKNRKSSDEWWVKYHPNTKHARAAKKRLGIK